MFDERTLEIFKHRNRLQPDEDISIDVFTQYISKYLLSYLSFDYHPFDSRILLLKEFNVRHITGKGKEAK